MKIHLIYYLLGVFLLHTPSFAEGIKPNIAYEEKFVFPIAIRLAKDLSNSINLKSYGVEPEAARDQKEFFEILYFNELISCAGPLDSLAPYFKEFEYAHDSDIIQATASRALGNYRALIELIVDNWNIDAKFRVIGTSLADPFRIRLPSCINKGVLAQNEVLRNAKQ
jgi:hypothetical protein